jgi:hypothetical protein
MSSANKQASYTDIFQNILTELQLKQVGYDVNSIKSQLKTSGTLLIVMHDQGCFTYVRNSKESAKLEGLFCGDQDWYHPQKSELMKTFPDGYTNINVKMYFDFALRKVM